MYELHERFSDRARKVLQFANQEAQRFNNEYRDTGHILLGLLKEGSGFGVQALYELRLDLRGVRKQTERLMTTGHEVVTMGKLPFTPNAQRALDCAAQEAQAMKLNYIGTEHILLGLMKAGEGIAYDALTFYLLKFAELRAKVIEVLQQKGVVATSS